MPARVVRAVGDPLVDRVDAGAHGNSECPPPAIAPASAFVCRCFAWTNQFPMPMTNAAQREDTGSRSAKRTTTWPRSRTECFSRIAWSLRHDVCVPER